MNVKKKRAHEKENLTDIINSRVVSTPLPSHLSPGYPTPVPFLAIPPHKPGHAVCSVAVRLQYRDTASLPRLASIAPGLVLI